MLFGECDLMAAGMKLGPVGNFYPKGDQKTIVDGSSACNVIQINCPSLATNMIKLAWDNQVQEIFQLTVVVKNELEASNIKGILSAVSTTDTSIRVATRPIYMKKPVNSPAITAPKPTGKVKLTKDVQQTIETKGLGGLSSSSDKTNVNITLGALRKLVPPWKLHKLLKLGVMALFKGVFTVWCPPGQKPILQFIAESIKVITNLCLEPEIPCAPAQANIQSPPKQV
ncbi:hypothetical protein BJ165DRAFT_1534095 [Panaeolus papilionaceus]|nr:hypothetical protein BJ165DRAFT_1534095 [Panaeolus papilionaceus]